MKYSKKIFLSLFWIVLGAILTAMYFLGKLPEFYNSFGFALVIVGILQLIRHIRYAKNKEYREKVDTLQNDERNKYLSTKAWAYAGYLFVFINAIFIFVFRFINKPELSISCSLSISAIILLYYISYIVLSKKY